MPSLHCQLFPVWKEEQESAASEVQRPKEVDGKTGRKSGSGDGQNPDWSKADISCNRTEIQMRVLDLLNQAGE